MYPTSCKLFCLASILKKIHSFDSVTEKTVQLRELYFGAQNQKILLSDQCYGMVLRTIRVQVRQLYKFVDMTISCIAIVNFFLISRLESRACEAMYRSRGKSVQLSHLYRMGRDTIYRYSSNSYTVFSVLKQNLNQIKINIF